MASGPEWDIARGVLRGAGRAVDGSTRSGESAVQLLREVKLLDVRGLPERYKFDKS